MNRLLIPMISLGLLASCTGGQKQAEADEAQPVRTDSILIKRLQALQQAHKIAIGHHDDPAYGHTWEYVADSSDVKNVTGDYPAIFDWDLGLIEWQSDVQLDSVPFAFIKEQAIKHAAEGGINTFSWHLRNPKNGNDSWGVDDKQVVYAALNDSTVNATLRTWMGRAADFLGELRDSTGTRIPVVFRPWHENTGSWFWWGKDLCTPDEYKALWAMTREVFDSRGIDNVVWAYSPGSENKSEEEFMERYPGDDLVDIIGFDTYYFGGPENAEIFQDKVKESLDIVTGVAAKHGKVAIMAETGYEGIPMPDWYTKVLYPAIKDYPIAYVVFWRNSQKNPMHYYTPYPGHPAAADFVEFYNLPQTVFLRDMSEIK